MTRTTFTTITPLPPSIPRQVVIDFLHDHLEMIDLNPLIKERHPISPPPNSPPEEHRCVWYSLTDRIDYLPGGAISGQVSYTCAFHDLPQGLQTHCYAPMGLDIRDRWSVGGSLPGEPKEPVELGLNAPLTGLYLREDVDLRCNALMAGFVKKTLKKSHGSLVGRLAEKAKMVSANQSRQSMATSTTHSSIHSSSARQTPTTPSILQSPTPASVRSESSRMSPMGPLLPSSTGNHQGVVPGFVTPPPPAYPHEQQQQQQHEQQQHQQQQHFSLPPPLNNPVSYLGATPQTNGSLGFPDHFPGATSPQGGLQYSGTVYRGSSKPQDYDEFTTMNPYEKIDSSREDQHPTSELNGAYPAPLQPRRDRRAKPAELE
ncbi:hypothetical protein B0J13DRAFT_284073 [Dactylonectria estremocensis]|uniref:DUF7053 domain-containing protein n=1 Tax=Dactylonectria estremocensis TaxID=1079267 RepID=A0A9P9JBJ6_9HYPO|nr:hypothetical protein B0J13DRAFT_284073 [Dactylonectria estremocensis]